MGTHQSSPQTFNQANWREVSSPFSEVVQYENCKDHNFHIERHRIQTTSKEEFDRLREIAFIRKHNPRWVAAVYFQEEEPSEHEFCASKYQASLFLQKIPIRLCDLRNIPFPDMLHLYDQALNGFYELARVVGCFPVECDYIGVNQRGVVKVWAGPKWSQISVKGGAISQEDMVRGIVECLEECVDKTSMPPQNPSLRNYLYRTADRLGFQHAIAELRNFSKATSPFGTPTRLHSLEDNPGRYDTDRQRIDPRNMAGNLQSSSHVPNHYSPRFSAQREQAVQEQITTFRKVDSVSNQPIHRQPPVSNFAASREGRPSSNLPSQVRIQRSLSNAQLASGIQLRPNSSYRQLEPRSVASINPPPSHRVSIGQHFSQQTIVPLFQPHTIISNIQNTNFTPNSSPNPNFNPNLNSTPAHPTPVYFQQDNRILNLPNDQKQSQNLSTKVEFKTDPPSLAGLPIYQPSLHQQMSQNEPHSPLLYPQYSNPGQPNPTNKTRSRNGTTQGQSIIMQLYTSQDNAILNPNAPVGETKHFGFVKRSESYHVDLRKFDSATVINDSQPGSMRGIPHAQVKYLTPLPNRNELSNLNSIQEVHTQNYWKENDSRNNSNIKMNHNFHVQSVNHIDNAQTQPSSIVIKNNHPIIDENDGKSSDDFLRKLKQFSNSNYFAGDTLQSMPSNNGRGVEKKKTVGFSDTLDVVDYDESRPKGLNLGKSAESKQEVYLNGYYDSKMFPSVSEGHPGIDPDIWADLQRYKQ